MNTASQSQRQTLSAIVYPVCVCGHSWPEHNMLPLHVCALYRPVRPVEDLGVISEKVVE